MKTKYLKYAHFIMGCAFFVSCSGGEETDSTEESTENSETIDSVVVEFESALIPGKSDWTWGQSYTSTVSLEGFNSDYDYWFAEVMTAEGEKVSLYYDEDVSNDLAGSVIEVTWELDTFYEAGEGDEPYLHEKLISYEILEEVENFEDMLRAFVPAYLKKNDEHLKWTSEELGNSFAFNPGAYCVMYSPTDLENWLEMDPAKAVISQDRPEGDFCEGYPKTQDGFYYEDWSIENMPGYYDMANDRPAEESELWSSVMNKRIKRVTVIYNESHYSYLYFALSDKKWWFFHENFCDCSA